MRTDFTSAGGDGNTFVDKYCIKIKGCWHRGYPLGNTIATNTAVHPSVTLIKEFKPRILTQRARHGMEGRTNVAIVAFTMLDVVGVHGVVHDPKLVELMVPHVELN